MKSAHQCNGTSTESKLAITQVFENYEYSILTHSELDNLNLKKKDGSLRHIKRFYIEDFLFLPHNIVAKYDISKLKLIYH